MPHLFPRPAEARHHGADRDLEHLGGLLVGEILDPDKEEHRALFLGQGSDLSRSLGVRPGAPEVEAAFQQVLKACKAHKIGCAISANTPDQVAKRVKEGWNIIRSTVPAIVGGRALVGEK